MTLPGHGSVMIHLGTAKAKIAEAEMESANAGTGQQGRIDAQQATYALIEAKAAIEKALFVLERADDQ